METIEATGRGWEYVMNRQSERDGEQTAHDAGSPRYTRGSEALIWMKRSS
jgi:hypothetical protein